MGLAIYLCMMSTDQSNPWVTLSLRVERESVDPIRNAIGPGQDAMNLPDDSRDDPLLEEILQRLAQGDVWAWAKITVVATIEMHGEQFDWSAVAGCVQARDEAEFRASAEYARLVELAHAELRCALQFASARGQ